MSETPAAAAPPGWYDDGTGSGRMRWWSGTEWTEHIAAPYSMAPTARPAIPADRPIYNPFIWLIVFLPLVSVALIFAYQPDFSAFSSRAAVTNPLSIYTPTYFLALFAGWVIYGLSAVFAWRDVVWLRTQGVERPFPWPWIFLYSPVYVIGRSVIVHRVAAPRGRAPIWAFIAVIVVSFIVAIAWTVSLMSGVLAHLPDSSHYLG